jgi:hypothetical protein
LFFACANPQNIPCETYARLVRSPIVNPHTNIAPNLPNLSSGERIHPAFFTKSDQIPQKITRKCEKRFHVFHLSSAVSGWE